MSRFHSRISAASALVARARLESLLEHDRNLVGHTDMVAILREEICALLSRHAVIDANNVHFAVVHGATASTLTVDIEVPFGIYSAEAQYCA
jgi:cell division topological specificity factor